MNAVLAPTGEFAGELWIAGEFVHVQGTRVGGVARYRGACYEAVGVPPTRAHGLVQFDGDIYIYGDFTEIDGRPVPGIARWDGSEWVSLGLGVNGQVVGACSFDGELVCVGGFTEAGGQPAPRVAAWNGSTWRAWPEGLLSTGIFSQIRDVGGVLTMCSASAMRTSTNLPATLLQWNGLTWVRIGDATKGVQDVAFFGGSLIATSLFGPAPGAPAGVVRWTGTAWEALGQTVQSADTLSIFDSKLLATGISGPWGSALWDGQSWTAFSPVRSRLVFFPPAEYDGGLTTDGFTLEFASGVTQYLGVRPDLSNWIFDLGTEPVSVGPSRVGRSELSPSRYRRLTEGAWRDAGPPPPQPFLDRIARVAGDDYALGYSNVLQGGDGSNVFLKWNGTTWTPHAVVEAVPGRRYVSVLAAAEIGGGLVVGGSFSAIGGVEANGIARQVGETWEPIGAGVNGAVGAITEFDGRLVVGLQFESTPQPGSPLVLVWDGTQFVALGSGLPVSEFPGAIRELREYEGSLYAAGQFITSDGGAIESLARWDGQTWTRVGGGIRGSVQSLRAFVYSMDEYEGQFVVAGSLKILDLPGQPSGGIWDGQAWTPLPAGLEGSTTVAYAIGDDLYVAGHLAFADGVPVSGLARFGPTPPPHDADLSGSADPSDPAYGVPDGLVDAADFFFFLDRFQQLDYPICDLAGDSDPASPCYSVPDGVIDLSDLFAYLDRMVN